MDVKRLTDLGYYQQLALGLAGVDDDLENPLESDARVKSEAARQALEQRGLLPDSGEIPEWMEEYRTLLQAGWPWRVAAYIAWAASPKRTRYPKTQAEMASKILGLTSDRVVHTWRAKNPAIDEMIAVMQAAPLMQHRRDVLDALATSATTADYKHNPDRKLFLELTGDYRNAVDVNHRALPDDDLANYSDEELARMAGIQSPITSPSLSPLPDMGEEEVEE
jgi:hypothetical protein